MMAALTWAVRGSLLRYVTGIARGEVTVSEGAELTDDGIVFPAAGRSDYPFAFAGGVTMSGHAGSLRIVLAEPVLHREESGRWLLSARGAGGRTPIAEIDCFIDDGSGVVWGGTTTLTPDGVAVFGGQYPAGSLLDSPFIRV